MIVMEGESRATHNQWVFSCNFAETCIFGKQSPFFFFFFDSENITFIT